MKQLALGVLISAASAAAYSQPNLSADLLIGIADQKMVFGEAGRIADDDISYGLRGVYNINPNIAVELAYQDYGQGDDSYIDFDGFPVNDSVSSSAFTAGAKGSIPLQNGLSVNARIGMSKWDVDVLETYPDSPGEVLRLSDSGTDFYYGIGAQLDMNEAFYLGVEYTVTDMDVSFGLLAADHEVKNLALYMGYSF